MAVQHPSTQYAALALGLILCITVDLAIQTVLRRSRGEMGVGRSRADGP